MTTPFGEIVALAKDRTAAGKRRMAVRFGETFISNTTQFTAKERSIALEILATVLRDATLELRRELSHRLAQEADIPKRLVVALANDVIEVARPMIQHSPALSEDDLLAIIAKGTVAHRIAAANRSQMTDRVAEALAVAREENVALALLGNIAIHIPETALRALAAQAIERGEIGEAIAQRSELTSEIAEKIYWIVSSELKTQIKSRFDLDGSKLDKILQETVVQLADRQSSPSLRRSVADRVLAAGRVDAPMLIDVLKNRGADLFKELLGGLSKFEPKVVDALCKPECSEPLALIFRALNFSKTESASLLMLVNDRVAGQTAFDPAALNSALTTFARLTPGDAKTVMWQWQSDPGYLFSLASRLPH